MKDAYQLGLKRGAETGRQRPNDRDLAWADEQTDGEIQTDDEAIAEFWRGMSEGQAGFSSRRVS